MIRMLKLCLSPAFACIRAEGPCNGDITVSASFFLSILLAICYTVAAHIQLWYSTHRISQESLNCSHWWRHISVLGSWHACDYGGDGIDVIWQGVWLLREGRAGFWLNFNFSAVFTACSSEIVCRHGRHFPVCTAQLSVHNAQNLVRGPLSGLYSRCVGEDALLCHGYSTCFKEYCEEFCEIVIWELSCMFLEWQTLCRAHKHAYY